MIGLRKRRYGTPGGSGRGKCLAFTAVVVLFAVAGCGGGEHEDLKKWMAES